MGETENGGIDYELIGKRRKLLFEPSVQEEDTEKHPRFKTFKKALKIKV